MLKRKSCHTFRDSDLHFAGSLDGLNSVKATAGLPSISQLTW